MVVERLRICELAQEESPMAKSVKKSGAAKKVAAKPVEPAERKPAQKKTVAKTSAAKKPAASANGTTNGKNGSITHDQVALLAHRFWIERGRTHGRHEEDWFRAERELHAKAS
jgi:DUF2934 family protein